MLLGTTALFAAEQTNRAARVLAETPGLVTLADDDGGRVEIFRHGQAARNLTFHGGAVIKQPIVEMIFLGDWKTPAAASRKADLQRHVEQIGTSESFQAMTAYGIRTTGILVSSRELDSSGVLNDLRIQSAINGGMSDGSLPLRDENVIRVIFLAPTLRSILRDHASGRDYHSYHSHVNLQDVNVRYVVVPYDADSASMSEAARQSLLRAIINPDGDGWY
jgi:hypothetical protein